MTSSIPSTAPTVRRRLPNRRGHQLLDFEHAGHRYVGGVGRFEDGTVAEVFVNASGRAGGQLEAVARDSAVLASLALQHGADLETLRCAAPSCAIRAARPAGPLASCSISSPKFRRR